MLFAIIAWQAPTLISDYLLTTKIPQDTAQPQAALDIESLLEELDIPSPQNEDN